MSYGAITIPFGRNLMRNPRPVSTTYAWAGGGGSVLLATDRSYVGSTSFFATLPAGATVGIDSGGAGSIGGTTTGVARTFAGKLRTSEPSAPGVQARVYAVYSDASTTNGTLVNIQSGTPFRVTSLGSVVSNPAKTLSRVGMLLYNPTGSTITVYVGGFQVEEAEAAGAYIDGGMTAPGAAYAWEGTPNDSTSTRAAFSLAPVRGTGGQLKITPTLYLVNRQNTIIDDVSEYFLSGVVTHDLEADGSKSTFRVNLSSKDVIQPYSDTYLRPHLLVEHSDGATENGSLGVYGVEPPVERWQSGEESFDYQGYDLLWVLNQDTLINGYIVQKDRPYRRAVIEILNEAGFYEPETVALPTPPEGEDPGADKDYGSERGGKRGELIRQLLQGAGWEDPWFTLEGKFTSHPHEELKDREPAIEYATGLNSLVRWPFEISPEPEAIGNRVVVHVKKRKKKGTFRIVAENTDPAHPFSYPRLGRWVDAPPVQTTTRVANHAAAVRLANAELEKAGMLPYRARLITAATIRPLDDVYLLNLSDANGEPIEAGQGKYWCTGWSMNLALPYSVTHNLRRVVDIAT